MRYNIKLVTQWGEDRGLVEVSQNGQRSQFIKGVEEGGGIFDAILKRDKEELVDAIGDRLVVLTLECLNSGLDPNDFVKRVNSTLVSGYDSFETAVKSREALEWACKYGSVQGQLARAVAKQQPIDNHVAHVTATLNVLATLLCVDIGECYRIAYTVIRDRTGSKVDGVFVKD